MQFTPAEIRLIALHARLARPLHETVRALAEALPEAPPRRILELARLACDPDGDDEDAPVTGRAADGAEPDPDDSVITSDSDDAASAEPPRSNPNDTEFRARMARDPMVLGLNRAIAQLRGERSAEQAVARVDAAIASGKLVPAQREWAIAYCAADAEGFNRFVGGQPALPLAAPGLPAGSPALHAADPGALTDDELRICTQTRTDPAKFAARRNQVHAAMAAQPAAGSIIRLELA